MTKPFLVEIMLEPNTTYQINHHTFLGKPVVSDSNDLEFTEQFGAIIHDLGNGRQSIRIVQNPNYQPLSNLKDLK